MISKEVAINLGKCTVGVSGYFSSERYCFVAKIVSISEKPAFFTGYLTEEFVEDEIDNSKNLAYLEKLTLEAVSDHLSDILKLRPNTEIRNTKFWFRDAKRKVEGITGKGGADEK